MLRVHPPVYGVPHTAPKKAKVLDDLAWHRAWGTPHWLTRDKKAWLVDVYAALSADGRYELEQTIHSLLVCEAWGLCQTGRIQPYGRYLAARAALSKGGPMPRTSARAERKQAAVVPKPTRKRTA